MKKIIIKTGTGVERIEITINGKAPIYCTLAVFSPDDDMCSTEVKTAEILNAAAEILKEIREGK